MNRKYNEAMEHIEVTPEMRSRILDNIENMDFAEKKRAEIVRFPNIKRYATLAACLAVMLVGTLALPNLLDISNEPPVIENNDIVAVYNPLGSPDEWSAVLGQSPKGAKIVYIAGVASEDNLHALMDGEIDAIVSRPYYEAGYIGMEMLDRVLQGETFAEDAWQPALPSYIVTADGAGKNGPDFYLDQYARAEAMFGPS